MLDNPYEYAYKCFGGKWKPLLLRTIYIEKVARFSSFTKGLLISERILSQTLKELEADGLVKRSVFPDVPVRVEYELTPAGESLISLMDAIYKWSRERMLDKGLPIDQAGEMYHGYGNTSNRLNKG